MAEQDIPNRASNMEKAEGDRNDAQNQAQTVPRRPHPEAPERGRQESEKRNPGVPDDEAKT